jgi:hypothetical protein
MDQGLSRRSLVAGALCLPLLALPGCMTVGDVAGPGLGEAIRRLLTISSQRAFTRLLTEEGFFADELARVDLPDELGRSGAIASTLLRTPVVQDRLLRVMNRAAAEAAEAAAPVVYERISNMTISDAAALVRGGPTAATSFLQQQLGTAIVDAMFPGVGSALRLFDNGVINQVVQAATGLNFPALQRHVASEAATGIYRAIAREEAAIRADPRATGDPVLARLFTLLR